MKKWMLALAGALVLGPLSAQAIEEVSKLPDGSYIFRCEFAGAGHKVQVKYLGQGEYLVLRRGSAATGESGRLKAVDQVEAAKRGCGE
ncbi:MAG: hypothetical protein RRB13_11650 [bacterium]|nr:hypothetical protein [bacterium]